MSILEKYRWQLDLLYELVRTSFKLRYNDSFLGFIWVLLKPLLSFLVLFLVFSNFKSDVFGDADTYQMYLLIGVVVYGYFSESILNGMNSLLGLAHIILKVKFPKELAVLSAQGLALINFIFSLLVVMVFAFFNPISPTVESTLNFIYAMAVMTVGTYSISLFSSVIAVKFRDLKNIFDVLLQLGFYLTPIIYPLALIPERFQRIFLLNPVTIVIQAARAAIIEGKVIYFTELSVLLLISIIVIIIGRLYFNSFVQKVAEYY